MDFGFGRRRVDRLTNDQMLDELERAAEHFNYTEFGWRDFNKVADISASAIKKHFGTWRKGLEALRAHLLQKGLDLSPRPHAPDRIYSDKELFDEMQRIWRVTGQRSSRTEWEMSEPRISYQCYRQRFGGWVNACKKFIEYEMGREILVEDSGLREGQGTKAQRTSKTDEKGQSSRNIPLSLRLKVLNRDSFRCVFCGKSPATDVGARLHIDHITPFSKGGKSILANLQTLCQECDLGKRDNEIIGGDIT